MWGGLRRGGVRAHVGRVEEGRGESACGGGLRRGGVRAHVGEG